MKKSILIVALCSMLFVPAGAQEKYSVVLERSKQLSPYEAIYLLMDYQYWHPEYSNIYYQLGNLCYDLLPTRDPLHHYPELSTLLYQSHLFYGNCLHFAQDQKLQGWQYAEIANGQKRIEYSALEAYVQPRLKEIEHQKTACDSIHGSFVRMTERYNRCQLLYTDFLTRYTREKTAHIELRPEERRTLSVLKAVADSLDGDIAAFLNALALQPVKGYEPVFRKEDIVLYRLDGLTHTDFLQNDVPLWDYSAWVKHFLDEQHDVYERLYADLHREHEQLVSQLKRYEAGRPISGQVDPSILGRCDRLEIKGSRVDSIRAMQEAVLNGAAEQTIAKSSAPQTIREIVPLLQIAAERREATPDSAIMLMKRHLIQMAHPLSAQQQPTYKHPIFGDVVQYNGQPGEKVHCLLPDDRGYRCVVTNAENAVVVYYLYLDMEVDRILLKAENEEPLVLTKIPGSLWALITNRNIYFLP